MTSQAHSLRARATGSLTIRTRLIGMVAVIGTIALICVAIAAFGLSSSGSKSRTAQATFNSFRVERDAYEGWLTDDDQSNMLAALAALNQRSQFSLMRTTAGQVTQGWQQALAMLPLMYMLYTCYDSWMVEHRTEPQATAS